MGIGRRAYLYVMRKKIRSILLFLIFFAAGLFMLIGISIRQSAWAEAEDFRKTLSAGIKIESYVPDPHSIMEERINEDGEKEIIYSAPLIREHHIEEFLAIEGVSGFYCDNLGRESGYTGLTLHPGFNTQCLNIIDGTIPLGGEITEEYRDMIKNDPTYEVNAHTNSFIEVYDSEWHPAFVNGSVRLVEGRHVRIDDVAKVVISDELAENNNLKVGDQVSVQSADLLTGEFYGDVYKTEIVGIFHINFEQKIRSDYTFEEDILANTFFSTPDIDDWFRYAYQVQYGYTVSAQVPDDIVCLMVVYVEDPALLDSVKEKLLAMDSIDWDYYKFGTYDKDFQTAASPLLSIIKISNILTVISIVGVLLILFLVLAIWIRSRKTEVGILYSMGINRNGLLRQFLIECCGIAAVAYLAALLLAGPATRLAGDLLQAVFYSSGDASGYEVVIMPNTSDMVMNLLPPAKGAALPYTVTFQEACLVFLLLMAAAAVSVLISSAKILKRKPKEILHN
jgi:ABC-type lipoprotein release transport system permease subunit